MIPPTSIMMLCKTPRTPPWLNSYFSSNSYSSWNQICWCAIKYCYQSDESIPCKNPLNDVQSRSSIKEGFGTDLIIKSDNSATRGQSIVGRRCHDGCRLNMGIIFSCRSGCRFSDRNSPAASLLMNITWHFRGISKEFFNRKYNRGIYNLFTDLSNTDGFAKIRLVSVLVPEDQYPWSE